MATGLASRMAAAMERGAAGAGAEATGRGAAVARAVEKLREEGGLGAPLSGRAPRSSPHAFFVSTS